MSALFTMLLNSRSLCGRSDVFKNARYFATVIAQTKENGDKDDLNTCENVKNSEEIGWDSAKPFSEIPGPKPIPILGNIWRYFPLIGNYAGLGFHEVNIRQNQEYGDLVMQRGLVFKNDILNLYNPKDIEKVCRHEGPTPKRDFLPSLNHYRVDMRKDWYNGYGGIFSVDGNEWHEARSKLNPILMQPRTVKRHTEPIAIVAEDFISKIKDLISKSPNGEMSENFATEVYKWALESICVLALDMRLGLLDLNKVADPEVEQFLQSNVDFFELIYKLDIEPSPWQYISTPTWRKYVKSMDSMTIFVQKHLNNAIQKLENTNETKSEQDLTILEKLLKHDRKLVFGTIIDMMFGGVDTTSRTVHAWLYYLASNPGPQEKLREEVRSVLTDLDTPITAPDLEKMPYLRATIKETLRLAPVSIGGIRLTNKDLVLSGHQVPKGTHVMFCNLTMCVREEMFSQANKFLPERWLRSDGKKQDANPWVYQPFGFGPRSCIGKRLASLELEILLAKIIRNFKMEWHHDEMKFKSTLLYGIADPLKVKMSLVKN